MALYYLDELNEPRQMEENLVMDYFERGELNDSTYVWREGWSDWVFFGTVKKEYLAPLPVEKLSFQEGSPVWEMLNLETFLVKKALDTPDQSLDFDIFEPEMGALIFECREQTPALKEKVFAGNNVILQLPHNGHQVARLGGKFSKVFGFSHGKISLFDEEDRLIGIVKKGNGSPDLVTIFSANGESRLVSVRGSLKDWDFQIVGASFAPMTTSRNWKGAGKELINEEGNFAISFPPSLPHNDPIREMTLITMLSLGRLLE